MPTQIKFRAWLRDKNLMVYTDGSDSGYGGTSIKYIDFYEKTIFTQNALYSYDFKKDDPMECTCVLMQFTGLLDKEGKEIYEGDVAQIYELPEIQQIFLISFENGCFTTPHHPYINRLYIFAPSAKIIGNKYENPELLKYEGDAR